ncbi:MAG: hypothetical protein H0U74_13205 [Bradymonadaceae bacterium]|nr:hypothetical protein [Lujinxingiaceae bacterium]
MKCTPQMGASLLILALVLTPGCADRVEVGNLTAEITAIGPIAIDDDGRLAIAYALRDDEGDDQDVIIEICEAPGERCGEPDPRGNHGGHTTTNLPTRPARTDVGHVFRWDLGCGRVIDNSTVAFELGRPYRVRITIIDGGNERSSTNFTLGEELGLTTLPDCP